MRAIPPKRFHIKYTHTVYTGATNVTRVTKPFRRPKTRREFYAATPVKYVDRIKNRVLDGKKKKKTRANDDGEYRAQQCNALAFRVFMPRNRIEWIRTIYERTDRPSSTRPY